MLNKYRSIADKAKVYYLNRELLFKNNLNHKKIDNPTEVIRVPVDLINCELPAAVRMLYMNKYNFNFRHFFYNNKKVRSTGIIIGGNWDVAGDKIENLYLYTAFQERFVLGKKWEETAIYDRFKGKKKYKDKKMTKYHNFEELKQKKLEKYDTLYHDMYLYGYKSQQELGKKPEKEVEVCVTKNGSILYIDGRHRIILAKLLKIDAIPVIVNVWHENYIAVVQEEVGAKSITPKEAAEVLLS